MILNSVNKKQKQKIIKERKKHKKLDIIQINNKKIIYSKSKDLKNLSNKCIKVKSY